MAETFSWPRLAVKAEEVLAAALVMAELAAKAAAAQAEACSPDMEAKAAQVKEPKAVC